MADNKNQVKADMVTELNNELQSFSGKAERMYDKNVLVTFPSKEKALAFSKVLEKFEIKDEQGNIKVVKNFYRRKDPGVVLTQENIESIDKNVLKTMFAVFDVYSNLADLLEFEKFVEIVDFHNKFEDYIDYILPGDNNVIIGFYDKETAVAFIMALEEAKLVELGGLRVTYEPGPTIKLAQENINKINQHQDIFDFLLVKRTLFKLNSTYKDFASYAKKSVNGSIEIRFHNEEKGIAFMRALAEVNIGAELNLASSVKPVKPSISLTPERVRMVNRKGFFERILVSWAENCPDSEKKPATPRTNSSRFSIST